MANGRPLDTDGAWLVECNVDAAGGRGTVRATHERARAKRFADAGEAMAYWKRQSKVRPLRPDGKPNRPLTAYTIEVLRDGQEPLLGGSK
jgi:hypothetical protein